MSLKKKAIYGFSWSMFEGVFGQGAVFLVGIILARLLDPRDFGLIGIITAFLSISAFLIDGGLKKALIRKIDVSQVDYSTVFICNVVMGMVLYSILFLFSGFIADFYGEPSLKLLFRCVGVVLILNSLTIIQNTLLIKKMDFKTQGIISIIAITTSGITAIAFAFAGYGIWSLVLYAVLRPMINVLLYWIKSNWKPSLKFSKKSFNELFNFGYKLLFADLLNTVYNNIYYLLIGKYFSTQSLGYFTRAQQFQTPISSNIALGVGRISLPVMSEIQNDKPRLRSVFIKFIRFAAFLNFTLLLMLAAMAKPLVLLLIGEKWETSIFYLQLLCVSGTLYPLQTLNLNLLMVKGYSDRYLKLEVIKKLILLPLVFVTVLFSIEVMLYGLIVFAFFELYLNSFYTTKLIDLNLLGQIRQVAPFIGIGLMNFAVVFPLSFIENLSMFELLVLQIGVGIVSTLILNELFKTSEYKEVKTMFVQILKQYLKLGAQ
ncbi:lipopolysaccharide biosynthesis protein [Allomuricauda sp. SCSIO 65647]|uniref:lipopolysaccharide biosynthesis protein n=1 Tax=Allomuricauda sp. SCSIO 65647 TaxID=2908843 RepID=UPI001F46B6CC|nr:lipopolysaccharide biosynthesis protein [Muricauda sp. SCSIO 65647]UJH67026.1 lipopolysaccharide biosynthesis protein [Muricauda sp. SCSIO 65647]